MTHRFIAACVLTTGVALAGVAIAQTVGPQHPPLVIRSLVGKDSFAFYCASCHGRDGKGDGPVAAALKTPPPDLRLLASRNGGEFPRERVLALITNGGTAPAPAHGTTDMPVWGPMFTGLEGSDRLVAIRIANIVQHLESLQIKEH